ncbi:hypothetical protein [Streptomyces alboflavus]|uniref:hypothetical protein n=1 Tax=Streptomyces alboflavus TaxID=67267 RepID=UPI00068BD147|nr:hypothetical protein [Streptomyces alboflavus]
MSNEPIDPNGIPQFTGDLEQLERDVADLRREASQFRDAGGDVHSDFQGLSAFYEAPEAEQLFATTKPVQTKTDAFADDLEKVAQALSRYATRVRPIVKKLKDLQTEASAFYIDEISTDDDWRKDDDKREHNNRLVEEVKGYTQTFRIAEMDCHNAITALVGGIRLTLSDDGTSSCGTYGYTDRVLDQAEKFPWGGKVEKERDGLDWLAHKALDVGKGFFVDGVGGTMKALGTLAGRDGWGAAGEAWKNLAKLGTGLSLTMTPVGGLFWMAKDEQLPGWLRDSRRAVVDTGKGLIAYDQWSKNPARAGGLVGFNAVTIVATRGAGSAAKTGAAAKTVSAIGKFGRAVDPFTYAAKGVQFGVTKVGDLMAPLRSMRSGGYADMAGGPYRLAERGSDVPARPAAVPDDARAYVNRKGDTIFMTREGVIVDEHGTALGRMDEAGQGQREFAGAAANHSANNGSHDLARDGRHGPANSTADPTDLTGYGRHDIADTHAMGTRRDYEDRVAPESSVPAPPKEPGDIVLATGDHVYFRDDATAIGYDRSTLINFDLAKPLDGYHDAVVHGNDRGFFVPGHVNESGVGFPVGDVHPSHIAEAIRNNPGYGGGPVRLLSCHTGWLCDNRVVDVPHGASDAWAKSDGADGVPGEFSEVPSAADSLSITRNVRHNPAAQELANELGVPVMAPTNKVGVAPLRGPGQTPTIADNGYWRIFLPLVK